MANPFGDGIPIPDVIDPPESMSMTLCIPKNRDHMSAFFGALYQLTVWNSWQQNGTQDGKELAAVWWRYYLSWNRQMSDIECEDGMSDCCTEQAIIRRVNPETGLLEQSTNGGSTWTPAAGGLPSYIVQPVPPITSGVAATKCDAATNVREQVSQWVTQVSNDFDTATTLLQFAELVVLAIVGAVLTILSAGALTAVEAAILAALAGALYAAWGAGKAVFDAYWVAEKLDIVLCAALCAIGDDGSFTDAQFSELWNKCNVDLPPSPAKMLFMGFLSSVGSAGLNSMAASGFSADADCSDCECSDFMRLWVTPTGGTQVSWDGQFLVAEPVFAAGIYQLYVQTSEFNEDRPLGLCGHMLMTVVSGAVDGLAAPWPCGSDTPVTPVAPIESYCANRVLWRSSVPFVASISAEVCV